MLDAISAEMYIRSAEVRAMAAISTVQARNRLAEVINRVAYAKERVILTRRGQELVAVVPVEDVRLLEELEDRLDLEDARAALAETAATGTTPWEKIKADLRL
jgi:prevent-host-death family protein